MVLYFCASFGAQYFSCASDGKNAFEVNLFPMKQNIIYYRRFIKDTAFFLSQQGGNSGSVRMNEASFEVISRVLLAQQSPNISNAL